MPDADALPPVSNTAVGVAMVRAVESARPDRLFDDPLAAEFAAAADWSPARVATEARRERFQALVVWITVRTRFLDDLVVDASAHGCRQVVILGAGLDARAFRLAFPHGTRLFELDLAGILEFKDAVITANGRTPACERIVVPGDLSGDWPTPLAAAGFDPTVPTVWLAEGLLVYLTAEQNEALIDAASIRSAVGSRLGLTLSSREEPPRDVDPLDHESLFRSASPGDAAAWLGPRGWRVEVHTAAERAHAYGRTEVPISGRRRRARLVDARRVPDGSTR